MTEKIFVCDERPESILAAVYDAWGYKETDSTGNRIPVSIEIGMDYQSSMFREKTVVEASMEKAEKVIRSIQRDFGSEMRNFVEGAILSSPSDRGDAVLRFLKYAYRMHRDVTQDLNEPSVMRVFELNRKSRGEAHLLTGFIRFQKLADGAFFARIGPTNDILPIIADHFAKRFNVQSFIIYDEKRKRSVVYSPGTSWYFLEGSIPIENDLLSEDCYKGMWQRYFNVIAIKERENYRCQRNLCPIHFRYYMDEFRA